MFAVVMIVLNGMVGLTLFHRARREVLKVHPKADLSKSSYRCIFDSVTRSSEPLGLHRVKVLEINPGRLHVGPIEAIDGTAVIDIKPVVESNDYC
jgi:tRNA (Thr-GGU) A37 N-methylase